MELSSVLVVENNALFRGFFIDALKMHMPTVSIEEAPSGEEALEKIKCRPPDVIFMDIRLPGKSGLELTREIKAKRPHQTIIIMTNCHFPEYRETALRYGADHFFLKDTLTSTAIKGLICSLAMDAMDRCQLN